MGTKINRSLKSKANIMQQQMLQPLIAYSKDIRKYGETYVLMDTIRQMQKCGIVTDSETQDMVEWLFISEIFRQLYKSLSIEALHSELDTSKLYIGMVVKN